ncbi:MAG: hypothetical protein KC423_09775 [Anaerolineales bacterium]|nr:hypothetical protein [Anaerolineales bacterium]
MTTSNPLTPFKQLLAEHFNLDELQDLAFALGVKWEEIEGGTLSAKSRGMVVALARNGRLSDLVAAGRTRRPRFEWPEPPPPPEQKKLASFHKPPELPFVLDTLPFRLRANVESFLATYLGTAEKPIPFGGRDEALRQLETWRTGSDKSFLLLAAPAGRGKSALLVRWYQALLQADEVAVIFVPISVRFNTNLAEVVFPCLAVQLAELQGREIPSDYIKMTPERWQFLVAEYLREPLPDGRQLLIILDGLDEAAWEIGVNLFPLQLPERVRVVVSARYLAGEAASAEPWLRRLGWERLRLAETLALETLTQDGVQDVLLKMGCPLDELGEKVDIVAELHRLSEGDPLLVELYVLDLWQRGEAAVRLQPEDLAAIEPGYGGFFARWWADQERLWRGEDPLEKEAVETLLYCLAMALGPLTISDLKALLPASVARNKRALQKAAAPLRRFIVGDGEQQGYVLAHPKLGDYFREEFLDVAERAEWEQRFIGWGQTTITALQAAEKADYDGVSRYLLQYYGRHLATSQVEVAYFLQLVSWVWLQSWQRYTGTAIGFLRDVDIVWERLQAVNKVAVQQNQLAPYLGEEVRCLLCHASINSIAANISDDLLVALYRHGGWTEEQALAQARQKTKLETRAVALQSLAPYLPPTSQQVAYQETLAMAGRIVDEKKRVSVLCALAPHLPQATLATALEKITDDRRRTYVLIALAPHLPPSQRTQVLRDALAIVKKMENEVGQIPILIALAPHLPQATLAAAEKITAKERRVPVLIALAPYVPQATLAAAEKITTEWRRVPILIALAPYVPQATLAAAEKITVEGRRVPILIALAPHLPQATFAALEKIVDDRRRTYVLIALAPHLPPNQRTQVLRDALAIVEKMENKVWQVPILISLAPHLPQATLAAAEKITTEGRRVPILVALAPHLPQATLAAAEKITTEGRRVLVLIALAPYLPQAILAVAEKIKTERRRSSILSALAPYLPQATLAAAEKIADDRKRLHVLINLAPYLPQATLMVAKEIIDEGWRAYVLSALAPYLPQATLMVAKEIVDEGWRAYVLSTLVPYLSPNQRDHMLETVLVAAEKMTNEHRRATILSSLAPFLPSKQCAEALAIALARAEKITDEWRRASILSILAPFLPQATLAAVENMTNERRRMSVLSTLVPYLPPSQRAQVLATALALAEKVANEGRRASLLIVLAPHSPQAVLAAAKKIKTERRRASVLGALAPYLPPNQRAQVLATAFSLAEKVVNEGRRASVLIILVPHLPQTVLAAMERMVDEQNQIRILGAAIDYLVTLAVPAIYGYWQEGLWLGKKLRREEGLDFVAKMMPMVKTLGGEVALGQTLRAVEDVCEWWP